MNVYNAFSHFRDSVIFFSSLKLTLLYTKWISQVEQIFIESFFSSFFMQVGHLQKYEVGRRIDVIIINIIIGEKYILGVS